MNNLDDEYELLPLTLELMKKFETNMEAFARDKNPGTFQIMAGEVHQLSNFDKGHVIIDLMVMLAASMRTLTEHQLPKLED